MTFARGVYVGYRICVDVLSRGGSALPGGIWEQRFRHENDRKGNGRVDPRTEKTFPMRRKVMKEEAGMKLWSPTRAFVGLAAAGLVALLGTTANASENIYKNVIGLNPQGEAGMDLNPGGSGQVLVGGLIDVRDNDGV